MVKILFLIPTLGHGGAERVLVNLVNRMDKERFDITVQTLFDVGIYRGSLAPHIKYKGGHKYYFRGNSHVLKLFSPKLLYRHFVKEEHYDIVVSYLEGVSARVASGCDDKDTKLISWIHIEQNTRAGASISFRSYREAAKCYRRFDRIYCVADTVRRDFTSLFPDTAPAEVVYNTVDTDAILRGAAESVDDIELSHDCCNICSVAKLMKTKGYDRLVRIQKRLKDEGIPTHVYIVGKGEEQASLEKMIKEYGLESDWTFVGFRKNPYKYAAACDLYVCSSRREGFSTSVTEALIMGVPVVSTRCSGAVELLGERDEYGIVTDNDEEALYAGIRRMITEKGILEHYRNVASERGKRFCAEETVRYAEKKITEVLV